MSDRSLKPRQVFAHHPSGVVVLSLFGLVMSILWIAVAEPLYMGFHDVFSAGPGEVMSADDSLRRFWFHALFGKPMIAFTVGLIAGSVFWLSVLRADRKCGDDWIEAALSRRRWLSVPSKATLMNVGFCTTFLLGTLGTGAVLGWSAKVMVFALCIPAVITYRERRRLYRALVERAMSQLPDDEVAPFERKLRGMVRGMTVWMIVIGGFLGGFLGGAAVCMWPTIQEFRWMVSSLQGTFAEMRSDDSVARSAETYLKYRPNAVSPRLTLASYYSPRRNSSVEEIEVFHSHALWLVEHAPVASKEISWGFVPEDGSEEQFYREIRSTWLAHLAEKPNDVRLIRAAAEFFEDTGTGQATKFMEEAGELMSSNERLRLEFAPIRAANDARLLKER